MVVLEGLLEEQVQAMVLLEEVLLVVMVQQDN
jgi:hypothetical protein